MNNNIQFIIKKEKDQFQTDTPEQGRKINKFPMFEYFPVSLALISYNKSIAHPLMEYRKLISCDS